MQLVIFLPLDAKWAILGGKPLEIMKIQNICFNFYFCNMLGVNWKYQIFSKESFFESKK